MIYKSADGDARVDKVGGKAFNLAHLDKNKMNVPAWFALTSDCFAAFLGEKRGEYMSLLDNYSEQSRLKILKLIEEQDFSDEIRQTVTQKIHDTFAPGDELSVRSSATDEDSEAHSFAGMMESYLNVSQSDDIFEYIKKCYLSCFSERIMEYRGANGLINRSISVSVIIQRMIEADYAGVMFTSNPQTNDPDETLISVVAGTGEKLVSGTSDSSDYVVDFFGDIAYKSVVDGVDIQEKLLGELYKIGQTIEKSYPVRRAQDIEFCVKNDEIYILQSRTITNYQGIDKSKFRTIYDNSNIIESYSGPTTPLTYSFAREVYAKVYNQTLKNFYIKQENIDEVQDDLQNMLSFYENKIYYRLNSWYKMTSLYPGYETNKKYMENMMGVKVSLNENKRQAKTRLVKIYARFIYKLLRIKKDSQKFKDKFSAI
ncbi:MAG: PEP/pyruvate-binding domain-containing protein, partial [Firmicutes bacterium]|nr:PEP/pyruvate-binding domain-containing protein [Bacillota bacterium]